MINVAPLSVPKISSGIEILAVREINSHSAPSSGSPLFRWFASHCQCLGGRQSSDARNLNSLIVVEARREVNDQVNTERRYYIASLAPNAQLAAEVIRMRWAIENSLHWVLDLAFSKDDLRVRAGNAPENLALIRKLAHNLLQ